MCACLGGGFSFSLVIRPLGHMAKILTCKHFFRKKKKSYVKISQSTVFKDKEARAYFVNVQEGEGAGSKGVYFWYNHK